MIPFEVIRAPAEMRDRADDLRRDGLRVAVVPTMGALHDGHLALLDEARRRCDILIVTIFVNPTQFGPGEDLDSYPRQERKDIELARAHGANLVFCPTARAMYPEGFQTFVEVPEVSRGLCGDHRPGHFRGVATVVCKLFNLIRPHVAVFGEKDYQQLALIRRLVTDLDLGIDIVGVPIVRDSDGLALSSRNRNLDAGARQDALALSRALRAGEDAYLAGESDIEVLRETVKSAFADCPGAELEYAEVRAPESLRVLARAPEDGVVFLVAARVGGIRLIDNLVTSRDRAG